MSWTTPRTWVAGETVTAAMLNAQIRDNLSVISPLGDITALTAYAPALGAVTTAPSLGTGGAISGAWLRIGALASGNFSILFGTAPSAGSGSYLVSLPTPAAASQPLGVIGTALITHAGNYTGFEAQLINTTQMAFRVGNTTNTSWSPTVPAAPASGDTVTGNFAYAAA